MFEILFKYPLSIFHRGTFVFLTPWPVWLMAIGILLAAGLLFWQVRRNHGMLSGLRPIAIWLLETGMVALVLFLLWHPALSVATLRPQQNVVAVLVDDSRSMAIADSSGTREAAAKSVLNSGLLKALGEKFQVRLYKFGKEPVRIPNLDQVTGAEPATRESATRSSASSRSPLRCRWASSFYSPMALTIPAASTSRPSKPSAASAFRCTPSGSARSIPTATWKSPTP